MSRLLWLDDMRDPEKYHQHNAHWVKDVDSCIAALQTGIYDWVSLDFDVQFDGRDGYSVIEWMQQTNSWPCGGVIIHSSNAQNRPRMVEAVKQHYGRHFQEYTALKVALCP